MKSKPIIKSQTRVKSMFAFMHEDEEDENATQSKEVAEISAIKNADLKQATVMEDGAEVAVVSEIVDGTEDMLDSEMDDGETDAKAVDTNDEADEQAQHGRGVVQKEKQGKREKTADEKTAQQNGVVVLKRSRGDVTVDATKVKKKEEKTTIPNERAGSKIVEVSSATYDGKTAVSEKTTFKMWWATLGQRIAGGWDSFIQRKGAMRFVIIVAIMVVLLVGLMIYSSLIRTDIKDLFVNSANAFVMTEGEESGTGTTRTISVGELAKDKVNSKNTAGFQYIEFTGKNLNKSVGIEKLTFFMYTTYSDVTMEVSLAIYEGDEIVFELANPQTYVLQEKTRKTVSIRINQSIQFDSSTRFVLTFESLKTSDLANNIETAYDVDFSLLKLAYA